jgi:phosphatidylglycerol:prolipoprotein diacylglycerol transferase
MYPTIFTIPWINRPIPGYGLMLMIAFLLAIIWATRRAMRSGANPDVILNCGFIALIAGVVGCRAMYVWHYWDQFAGRPHWLDVAWSIIDISRGGMEYYGGFILATVCVVGYLVLWKHSLRWYLDIIAPSAALGLAIGRIGCFLNGCCYGGVCSLPWAVSFPFSSPAAIEHWKARLPGAELPQELLVFGDNGLVAPVFRESMAASDAQIARAEQREAALRSQWEEVRRRLAAAGAEAEKQRLAREEALLRVRLESAARELGDVRAQMDKYHLTALKLRALAAGHRSLPVHPTQLYSTVAAGLLAALLNAVYWRRTRDGQVICLLLMIEPPTRWVLELIRTDNPVDTAWFFTISQFLAMLLTAAGVVGWLVLRRMPARSPRAVLWEPPEEERERKDGRRPAAAPAARR